MTFSRCLAVVSTFLSCFAFWAMPANSAPDLIHDSSGNFILYAPTEPTDNILVILHDTPTGRQTYEDAALSAVQPWVELAEEFSLFLLAPVLDDEFWLADRAREENYLSYLGRSDFFDEYLIGISLALLNRYGMEPNDILLFGQGAGGEVAARFAWTHAGFVQNAVVISPTAYTFPRELPWPYGISPVTGSVVDGAGRPIERVLQMPLHARALRPEIVTIIVGTEDINPLPELPGHNMPGRAGRAIEWSLEMNRFAASRMEYPGFVSLNLVGGVGNSTEALVPLAIANFRYWLESSLSLSEISDVMRHRIEN